MINPRHLLPPTSVPADVDEHITTALEPRDRLGLNRTHVFDNAIKT